MIASCYIIFCFGCLTGFIIHFYIIFGTNLLTGGPAQISVFFCIFQCFAEKEYQTESKRNETFGSVIFGTNVIKRTWSERQAINEAATRQGRAYPPGRALHSHGPLVAPPTYFFLLYIPTYPQTIKSDHENLIPPPQPSVPVRSHLGAFFGAPPEGASITEGLYINSMAPSMMCE